MTRVRIIAAAGLFISGLLALAWAYSFGGGASAGVLDRTGPAVLWGLPAMKLVFNVASATTAGALALSVFALAPRGRAYAKAVRIAGISSIVACLSAAMFTFLNFIQIVNVPLFAA